MFHVIKFVIIFRAGSFAFDYKKRPAIRRNANIGASALGQMTELPKFFKLNIGGIITLIKQTIDALKDNEIFSVRFVIKIISVTTFNLRGVIKFFICGINFHCHAVSEIFFINIAAFGKVHNLKGGGEIFF